MCTGVEVVSAATMSSIFGPGTAALTLGQAVSAVGAVSSAYGAFSSASASKAQARYNAGVQRNNQIIAERMAKDAIDRGNIDEKQHRLKVQGLIGRQRSVLSSSGFSATEDDALDILGDTAEIGELEALTIRSNAEREAWKYKVNAANAGAEATLSSMKADAYSPFLAGGSELFTGLGSVAAKWYK